MANFNFETWINRIEQSLASDSDKVTTAVHERELALLPTLAMLKIALELEMLNNTNCNPIHISNRGA